MMAAPQSAAETNAGISRSDADAEYGASVRLHLNVRLFTQHWTYEGDLDI